MTELVACLSNDNLPHLSRLIKDAEWEKIILIADSANKTKLNPEKKSEYVIVDFKKPIFEIINTIKKELRGKITGVEVAVNIVSGTGKEHMAVMSALLQIGVGMRFVAVTKEGVKEL